MIELKKITSNNNPLIKKLKILQKKSIERKKNKSFIVEGAKEIEKAIKNKYEIESVFISDNSLLLVSNKKNILSKYHENCFTVKSDLFKKICYRSNDNNIIAIIKAKEHDLDSLIIPEKPLIVIIQSPEKPGNIGAIIRTLTAAKIDLLIIADPKTDIYNPNIIRSSLGNVFSLPIIIDKSKNIINFLKSNKIEIIVANVNKKSIYHDEINYNLPLALVLGSEDKGISNNWIKNSDCTIKIPMKSNVDSLNLSVSAGILIYHIINKIKRIKLIK